MNARQDDFARDWRDAVREIEGLILDVQTFISATFKFKEPIGPEANAELQYGIDHSTDDHTIEDIAREKLGLVKPGEVIFYDTGD